jgi:hypothetical protein
METKQMLIFLKSIMMLILFASSSLSAQEVTTSAGDFHQNSNFSVSWTIGEPVIDTWSASGTVLTQGFQQPILVSVSIYENPDLNYTINAFPNPTSDFLNVVISNGTYDKMQYLLFDVTGKLIDSRQIVSEQTEILFSHLPVATYYVKIIENNKELKTFKIIKN